MKNKDEDFFAFKPRCLTPLALVIILYLMYSPTFLVDYLMNDEWGNIGLSPIYLRQRSARYFFTHGRGLFGIYQWLVYSFVEYDPLRVQFIRFVNFASIATIAVILLRFVEARSKSRAFAFFTILFFLSQPSFQSMMGYSLQLISNSQPSIWLSLLAFYLHFFPPKRTLLWNERFPQPLQVGVVFLLLLLAMQSTQTYAFFAMIPLTYLALTDWKEQKNRVLSFLLIALVVFLLSSIIYKIGLEFWHAQGHSGYHLGERGLETAASDPWTLFLRVVNPLAYWSVFKVWSYPFPLHYTLPLDSLKKTLASLTMVAWMALVLGAIITELQGCSTKEKRAIFFKWLTVLACLGFGALFLVADSPQQIVEHRPHMTLTSVGVVIFCGAYSLSVLASKYLFLKSEVAKCLAIILVMMIAFGAQAGVLRGIVNNRMEQISFIRTELMSKNPASYKNIIVVLPRWRGCITEPCGPWMGKTTSDDLHMVRKGAYRYALTTMGVPPNGKNITFVEQKPDTIPKDSLIIDWNKYVSARKRYLEYLRSQ